MQIPKLSQCILLQLDFTNLVEISFDDNFSPLCDWGFWAEKAKRDYNIPIEIFDLPQKGPFQRKISPLYRFLECVCQIEFLPGTLGFFEKNGEKREGIFSPLRAIQIALKREDHISICKIFSGLDSATIEIVRKKYPPSRTPSLYTWTNFNARLMLDQLLMGKRRYFSISPAGLFETWFEGEENQKALFEDRQSFGVRIRTHLNPNFPFSFGLNAIKVTALKELVLSGNEQALDRALVLIRDCPSSVEGFFTSSVLSGKEHMVAKFLKHFSVLSFEQILFLVNNGDVNKEKCRTLFSCKVKDSKLYVAAESGNFNLYRFFFRICSTPGIIDYSRLLMSISKGLKSHPERFVGFYQILNSIDSQQIIQLPYFYQITFMNIDVIYLYLSKIVDKCSEKKLRKYLKTQIKDNEGNLNILQELNPWVERIEQSILSKTPPGKLLLPFT